MCTECYRLGRTCAACRGDVNLTIAGGTVWFAEGGPESFISGRKRARGHHEDD